MTFNMCFPTRTALLSVLGVAALGVASLLAQPVQAGTQTIRFTDSCPPPPAGAPYGTDGQLCAMVSVPLDYRKPNGQRISVAVSMIPAAKPSARRGVLFLNPGGPGGSQALDLPRIFTFLFSGTP